MATDNLEGSSVWSRTERSKPRKQSLWHDQALQDLELNGWSLGNQACHKTSINVTRT